ncbi:MAG TPA: ATP-binding protein [Ktedonobacteraceae bacterium]|nr:ATP-binding protein [Ktedonobacteraceae bacterium]
MSTIERMLPVQNGLPWQRYLLDSVLAFVGAMLVTAIIYFFHLYPRIPNVSIVYLLVVLALASIRGRYASILASLVAFLSFDYFLVPPLYVFTINRIEEWIALFVFLVTAILTSQLAVELRERANQAQRREHETHILYDLLRLTNREGEPGCQLHTVTQAVVDVFSSWGVQDCAILLPDSAGNLRVQASAYQPVEQVMLSAEEQTLAAWVMSHGRTMSLYDETSLSVSASTYTEQRAPVQHGAKERAIRQSLRLIPLKLGQKVVGVLRLRVLDQPRSLPYEEGQPEEHERADARTAFFWTFLDEVTTLVERSRLQRENLRIAVLQRIDAMRMALLSSVSHDLRTPLTSIKAAASSLLQSDVQWDEETRRGFAQTIEQEADRLNRLVSNLLDMSRIEEGALKPEKELYSLKTLIYDVLARMEPVLKGRELRTCLPDDLLLVELDYVQMDQVLTNLIENAVRYTPAGTPVEVSARVRGEEAMLSIADRGPGVPTADLERIFDKFYRVQASNGQRRSSTPTGTGLGLAVSRGIVEAHGGRIWAEERESGGLVVFVVLPVREREEIAQ